MKKQILILLFFIFLVFFNLMLKNGISYFGAGFAAALALFKLTEIFNEL